MLLATCKSKPVIALFVKHLPRLSRYNVSPCNAMYFSMSNLTMLPSVSPCNKGLASCSRGALMAVKQET